MHIIHRTLLLFFVAIFAIASSSYADKNKNQKEIDAKRAKMLEALMPQLSKRTGDCTLGISQKDLDVNNVRARLYNTNGLFFRGDANTYFVPKNGPNQALFASGIWVGGLANGELRMAAADYGPWEFWPGPIDENGNPPADCSIYDRMYKVSREDLANYTNTGVASEDLRDWPFELGAPVVDGDGDPNNYNLAGGDRPELLGDQMVWWITNDLGGAHAWSLAQPIGLEVRTTAFAFRTADAINNMTFYKYELVNKGDADLTQAYFGIWSDPDLGDALDDYVGADTTRGIGYVWNGGDVDGSYGVPPALGYDYFQGPLVNDDNIDNDKDGEVDEDDERISLSKYVYYNNDDTPQGNPQNGPEIYGYLRGFWRDNVPITFGGSGRGFSNETVDIMFPGDVSGGCAQAGDCFWSEEDTDGNGSRNTPADRRFVMSSGPFTLRVGAVQEIVYGVVWSQANDRFSSVAKMQFDDALAQAAFDVDFQLPQPPDPPRVTVGELDEVVTLSWSYEPTDNNYLDSYDVFNPFLADVDVPDKTYTFEGYVVYEFPSETAEEGEVIATFDVAGNFITQVTDIIDAGFDIPTAEVVVFGEDEGVKHSIQLPGRDNNRDYYVGVQAYAYNEFSAPRVFFSPMTRLTVRPSKLDPRNGGTVVNLDARGDEYTLENGGVVKTCDKEVCAGGGLVTVDVVDPSITTGHTYAVEFYADEFPDPEHEGETVTRTNYDIVDENTGEKVFDGSVSRETLGEPAPQNFDILVVDGLNFSISGPEPGPHILDPSGPFYGFVQVQGIGDDDACGPSAGSTFGCAQVGGNMVYQSFNGQGDWIMYHPTGAAGSASVIGSYAPNDFEIRSTEAGSYGYHPFTTGAALHVPFEVWDIGPTGPFGVNDPADDVQMIPNHFSDNGGECFFGFGEIPDDPFGLGWPATDRIYAYYPVNNDYAAWEAAIEPVINADAENCPAAPETDAASELIDFGRGRPIQRDILMMDPTSPNYRDDFIPVGNIIRMLTTKPNLPGEVFTIDTGGPATEGGLGVVSGELAAAQEALDLITVVPNPYKGASEYELSNLSDVARFTNLPERATIRIFTLSGTLIKTLAKEGEETSIDWNLQTDTGLPIASGMYLVHVEVPNVGEKVIKFGVIKKRIQLDLL